MIAFFHEVGGLVGVSNRLGLAVLGLCIAVLSGGAGAESDRLPLGPGLTLDIDGVSDESLDAPLVPAFGEAGSKRVWFEAGVGTNFEGASASYGGVGFEYYAADGLAIGVRFDGLSVRIPENNDSVDTPSTVGAGCVILIRWQFIRREKWSLFFEGGSGIAYFANRVPRDGTQLDFTPQAGFGVSIDAGNNCQLLVGARWFHISNGQTGDKNPGFDSLQLWAGVSLPF